MSCCFTNVSNVEANESPIRNRYYIFVKNCSEVIINIIIIIKNIVLKYGLFFLFSFTLLEYKFFSFFSALAFGRKETKKKERSLNNYCTTGAQQTTQSFA